MKDIFLTALSTGAVLGFVQFLISRHDDRDGERKKVEDALKEINDKLAKNEKDNIRTQLLFMILLRPGEKKEILTLGQHYFEVLKGNWYMTDIFDKWLEEECDSKPEWFKKED